MKKSILTIVVMGLVMLAGCAKTPESTVKNGVVTAGDESLQVVVETLAAEDVPASVPERLQQTLECRGGHLEIDAEVIVPDAEIVKGTAALNEGPNEAALKKVLFDDQDIVCRDDFYGNGDDEWVYASEEEQEVPTKVFAIQHGSDLPVMAYDDYSIARYFSIAEGDWLTEEECSDEQKQEIDTYRQAMQALLDDLGFHQKVVLKEYCTAKDPYVVFSSVNVLDGVTVCTNDAIGLPPEVKASGQGMEISDHGLGHFAILADFSVQDSEKCELMSWESLMSVVEKLAENQSLGGQFNGEQVKIVRVELKYLILPEGDMWQFHPVWSFEAEFPWVAGTLPMFAVDASTGDLEFMNAN